MRIFLAGATGVIGRPLCRLLRASGYDVTGTTRSRDKAASLEALGVTPVVVDGYDAGALLEAVRQARPDCVIHQLTDLPDDAAALRDPNLLERNARLRIEGTRNLVAAAQAAGAKRIVAQSIAFAYAPKTEPYVESDPLAPTAAGVISLEQQVLNSGLAAVVLRYGRLYGPGTWAADARSAGRGPLHVDAAAQAALLAVTRGEEIYNIAEDDGFVTSDKAKRELGFDAAFRILGTPSS